MLPFHDRLFAVYGLLPETSAFQSSLRVVPSPYSQVTSQPSMALALSLVMRMSACAPDPQSLTTTYSQLAAAAACIDPHIHTNSSNDEFLKVDFFIAISLSR